MVGTGLWRCAALAVLTAGFLHPARAELSASREQIKQTVALIVAPVALVEALAAQCDTFSPNSRESRQAALKAWRDANRIDAFQAAIVPILARAPGSVASASELRDKAAAKAKAMTEKTPAICENFDAVLREKVFAVGDPIAEILPVLAAANARLAAGTPSAPPPASSAITLYTIVQLSTAAEAAMNTVAAADAAKDRKIRETREHAGKAALEALGVIAVRANVVDRDDLREWRGDQQSAYKVNCRAFVDKQTEERFKGLEGSETTIAGKVANFVVSSSGGGNIILAKCGFVDGARLTKANLPESGGLALRPPNAQEANAGPGKGIQMGEVEKIAYKSDVRMGIDGFGNLYSDRNEDTYILLKDGTAYHHHWRFPFTDLNVALVKYREPWNWYRWRQEGKDLVLTAAGGEHAGKTKTVSGAGLLKPFPPGALLHKAFKFLHVGMMGVRRERDYVFRRDGTLDLHKSNIVAGRTFAGPNIGASGPGFAYSGGANASLIVAGRPNEQRVRYRIDGYVLELTADDGEVQRHFIGRFDFDDDNADGPGLLYLGGEMLWDRDKEDKPTKKK
jgi:hypothetical protein